MYLHFQQKKKTEQKRIHFGFSLIEVLVSLSIFSIVITIAIGSLMVLIAANARMQNTQAVMTNISYAFDSMTREMRTGSDYFCGDDSQLPVSGEARIDCPGGGGGFSFNEGGVSLTEFASSNRIAYRLENASIERRLGNGAWLPVTAPEIEITQLIFYVTGSLRGDTLSPTVTIYIEGNTGSAKDESEAGFSVQTTVVQQLLDI